MKNILLGFLMLAITWVSAQNFPDYYPSSSHNTSDYYGDSDDEFYFPDDYYYEYPADYYTRDLHRKYYNDYQQSIYNVNWNRFFYQYRLSSWQMQQVIMLNDSFPSYASWHSFYRYNPDRWYYDRFYALQRILGSSVFVIFQNNYYQGYNPVLYYQNYNRRNYTRNVYIVPRYRQTNINIYRVNRTQYHKINPRNNIGFQQNPRNGNTPNLNSPRNNGFRNDTVSPENNQRNSTRADTSNPRIKDPRKIEAETNAPTPSNNGGGFRNDSRKQETIRNIAPPRNLENNSRNPRNQSTESRTPSSIPRNSGQRFTTR
jgi:hypothetical protein